MTQTSEDTLRIVISTDNHLGVFEKDVIRGKDSFTSFEEVLQLAKEVEADMVLLGGDFFHESEPSHNTLVNAEKILSKYCLNDNPVHIQILSDQSQDFAEGKVNFENPKFNVGLPVFSIHGNHDYPHGERALSAMDIPSAAGLINYFGKTEIDADGTLTICPVLIQKGRTKLALYGLGHIADQRLGRVFRTPGAVQWTCPSSLSEHASESWFHLLVLHQNRVKRGLNSQAYLEDRHLAKLKNLDFVLWGHEHDCIAETKSSTAGDFEILQPGSTVATSLAEGESKEKHAFILEIVQNEDGEINHRIIKQRLETVRPFVFESVVLSEQHGVYNTNEESIKNYLQGKIDSMIKESMHRGSKLLPLIRLRIDYTGFEMIRAQEVQRVFNGKVANPDDMLLWTKKPARKENTKQPTFGADVAEPCVMDELIANELNGKLKILSVEACSSIFSSVISSTNKISVSTFFDSSLEKLKSKLMKEKTTDSEEGIRAHLKRLQEEEDASGVSDDISTSLRQYIEEENENEGRPNRNRRQRSEADDAPLEEEHQEESTSTENQTTALSNALRNPRGVYRRQTKRRL